MAIDILHTRNLFLRCMCGIYLFAFSSLYLQIPGLYGDKGILPAHTQLTNLRNPLQCFAQHKTLICYAEYLGLNVAYTMELLALIGSLMGAVGIIWKRLCTSFYFFVLWSLYLSLWKVGQTFLWFQWDSLLLEVGFLCMFVAPLNRSSWYGYRPRNLVTMWLVRWCLFRLMFSSGVVKLQSNCPTWWGLTALEVHHESQCIPTTLAWFFHHLPAWYHKLCVVMTYMILMGLPFLFFSPMRCHRIFAFYGEILLQIMIMASGNYNFFNLLAIVLCLSLIDDLYLGYRHARDLSFGFISYVRSMFSWIGKWSAFAALIYFTIVYFNLRIDKTTISPQIAFTKEEFSAWVSKVVPFTIALGAFSLIITIAEALSSSLFEVRGVASKAKVFLVTLVYSAVAISLFGLSLVPYTSLDHGSRGRLWPVLHSWYDYSSEYNIASSYGLFRSMTGVGGRPEVIIQGSNDLTGPWREYEFPYKPGNLYRAPPFVLPHQPRLDWQLWFAALGSYNYNPWLISLAYRLLSGENTVIQLLDSTSPWRRKPPKYLKAVKYLYRYTLPNDSMSNSAWWRRDSEEEYLPVFTADHAPLLQYLRKVGVLGTEDPLPVTNEYLRAGLARTRALVQDVDSAVVIWALLVALLTIVYTRRLLNI